VRRTLAGLLFGLAYACASLSIAGFILQRTAFDPSNSADAADVVLGDTAIKAELVNVIADAVSTQLSPLDPANPDLQQEAMRARVSQIAGTAAGAALLAEIIHDAHAHLIGQQKEPVQITGQQLVDATQMQAAASVPAVTLPVPKITALDIVRHALTWLLPIMAIATVVLVAMGLFAHPEKSALFKSLGLGLLLLALLVALFGYVIPKFLVPALSDSVWAGLPARLADDSLALIVGLELLLIGSALGLLAGTGMMRRRQRWSTPVSTYRYNEERRWS
jgi:hypothetical protein